MSEENGHITELTPHQRKVANLRPPWKPGQSGNPNNPRKHSKVSLKKSLERILSKDFPEIKGMQIPVDDIRLLIDKPKKKPTNKDIVAAVAVYCAMNGDFRYFKEIMDRIDGPVTQKVEGEISHINVPVIEWVK